MLDFTLLKSSALTVNRFISDILCGITLPPLVCSKVAATGWWNSFIYSIFSVWRKYSRLLMIFCVTVNMSESDITNSVKNGILFLEDPFDQVCGICQLLIIYLNCFKALTLLPAVVVAQIEQLLWCVCLIRDQHWPLCFIRIVNKKNKMS